MREIFVRILINDTYLVTFWPSKMIPQVKNIIRSDVNHSLSCEFHFVILPIEEFAKKKVFYDVEEISAWHWDEESKAGDCNWCKLDEMKLWLSAQQWHTSLVKCQANLHTRQVNDILTHIWNSRNTQDFNSSHVRADCNVKKRVFDDDDQVLITLTLSPSYFIWFLIPWSSSFLHTCSWRNFTRFLYLVKKKTFFVIFSFLLCLII